MRPASRPLRCAIYTRKSSEEGLEQDYNSLHAQRDACAAYVLSQAGEGWTLLPEVYDDGGFSGGNMERPALKRLMADVASGLIDVVVVYKVDRLTRALPDFSRIVDVLDKAGSSFVSVTQAFNTTTSMGRLTLNVLLSFAQFEREVTGERIRDKIAASKKLGMWMGGGVPLGYEASGRTLVINPVEAETVRGIFRSYLDTGSVHQVQQELNDAGVVSRRRTTKAGVEKGGQPMDRGALFHMLRNCTYVGEIPHKTTSYPGQHPAIIDRETFDAVQARLDDNDRKQRVPGEARRPHKGAPLMGLLFDSAVNPMSPVKAAKPNKPTYHYYVSTAVTTGRPDQAGAVSRISAPLLEDIVAQRLGELRIIDTSPVSPDWAIARDVIDRVEVGAEAVTIVFDEERLQIAARDLKPENRVGIDSLERRGDLPMTEIKVRLVRRGGTMVAVGPQGSAAVASSRIDRAMTTALIRAESWKRRLLAGEVENLNVIADAEGVSDAFVRRMIRPAFLAPDLKAEILDGRQPVGLTLEAVTRSDLPLDWVEQRRLYAG
ncbi:recombinase family protein [Brevundimonas subvibrioides]|uniref:Resolvase domain protein n=1 Tax=Brevundimonas subvibrioides (strain ATCC 15264 / DSM 4735 / LMG 14903 / NBRC 16000 / CB 81) TaxID=633149 RepID=D9QI49_BRESC|nr:recombinase family protein [Brevundimonas subvibrioides]ADL01307.1 Resolvase domain protein [Brevundimonas subvibrioides ATCC 15264]